LAAPGRGEETLAEITEVVDAIKRRDADTAERLSRAHVERAAAFALASLADEDVEAVAAG
jgi:DNA-binding GntR family transcriptional regulator